MEIIVPGRKVLNDRHADESMCMFERLTSDLVIEGYEVCSVLRYSFFSDCLRTSHYLNSSRRPFRYWLMPTGCQYQARPAAVLFAQEGIGQSKGRESENIEPIVNWLSSRVLSAGVICAPSMSRLQRLCVSVGTIPSWRSLFSRLESYCQTTDSIARRLMKEFDLEAPFLDWFRCHVALSLARIRKARLLLETEPFRPKVIVFSSEHHPNSRPVLLAARDLLIPTVLVQHGFLGQKWLHWPVQSEKLCVWGEVDRRWYLDLGFPESRLELTGSHRAFTIDCNDREAERKRRGLKADQRAVIFFAPNLDRSYHIRAGRFLGEVRSRLGEACHWFVRLHPSQAGANYWEEYVGFTKVTSDVPLERVCTFADLVLHDYSTMAFAEYAGIETMTLSLDPPYPAYYRELGGDQQEITSVEALCEKVQTIRPGYRCEAGPTKSMATGGAEALDKVGKVILEVMNGG